MSTGAKNVLSIRNCTGSLKSASTAGTGLSIAFDLRVMKNGQGLIDINTSAPAAIGPLTTFQDEAEGVQLIAHGPDGEYIEVMDADISNTSVTARSRSRTDEAHSRAKEREGIRCGNLLESQPFAESGSVLPPSMMALEHMVTKYTEGKSKARFDKKDFANKIQPAFHAAAQSLKEQGVITEVDLRFLERKLGDLNRLSLRGSLEGMLREWDIRFEDLASVASIADLITIRNRITHQGALPDADDDPLGFWRCLEVLIELLKRILMGVWGYQGRYISHLGRYHEAVYPPCISESE